MFKWKNFFRIRYSLMEGLNPFAVVREGLVALGKWLGEVKIFKYTSEAVQGFAMSGWVQELFR